MSDLTRTWLQSCLDSLQEPSFIYDSNSQHLVLANKSFCSLLEMNDGDELPVWNLEPQLLSKSSCLTSFQTQASETLSAEVSPQIISPGV